MDMENYLTVEELAETLRVDVGTVRRWLRTGTLRGLKLDRVWRIPQTELRAHLMGATSGDVAQDAITP
jgi:acetyl-CoA synthetase